MGVRQLTNSFKLSFQSAFSSESSMRASTHSDLRDRRRDESQLSNLNFKMQIPIMHLKCRSTYCECDALTIPQ